MPVIETCSKNSLAVVVNLTDGQRLRYTIAEDEGVQFTLRTEVPTTLLKDTGPDRVHDWPTSPADGPSTNPATHTLGMAFGQTAELRYRVELLNAGGTVIAVIKNCTYGYNGTPPQSFHTALEIHTI